MLLKMEIFSYYFCHSFLLWRLFLLHSNLLFDFEKIFGYMFMDVSFFTLKKFLWLLIDWKTLVCLIELEIYAHISTSSIHFM